MSPRLETTVGALRLARWLGPWTSATSQPPRIRRREVVTAGARGPLRVWIYEPTRPTGRVFVVPGLHFLGPADARMDRFCRALAASGIQVAAPFLPSYLALRAHPDVVEDVEAAFDAVLREPGPGKQIGVFSISFGSLPAIRLAAARAEELGGLVVFGGYASWQETLRFALEGDAEGRVHDPLSRPVAFLQVLEHLPGVPADPAPLAEAFMRFVRATWNRPPMKEPARYRSVARSMVAELPPSVRELFLLGTGAVEGSEAVFEEALARAGEARFAHLDPLPSCRVIATPTLVVHGKDDDVIPWEQAQTLAATIPGASLRLTGLYGHSAKEGSTASSIRALGGELSALSAIVKGIAAVGRQPLVPA
ncbi:MAG: alpha/beta hydrolase [Myxococcota bacterium]